MIDLIMNFKNRCNIFGNIGKSYDLTEREVYCVTLVHEEGQLSSKALSAMMRLSPSRGSRIITRLINKGFLTAISDAGDRRSLLISLTEKGSLCVQAIEREKSVCEQKLLQGLKPEEVKIVEEGFRILLRSMD